MNQLTCLNTPYFFHFHSTFTDGKLTIYDYFKFCKKNQIKTLIFSEHVRKDLTYDFDIFIDEIKKTSDLFPEVDYMIGVEAKLLPGGECDVPKNMLNKIDLIAFACHGFPNDPDLFYNSMEHLFHHTDYQHLYRVWAHPGRFYKKRNLLQHCQNEYHALINVATSLNIYIERNIRDDLIPYDDLKTIKQSSLIWGMDAHINNDLSRWTTLRNEQNSVIISNE